MSFSDFFSFSPFSHEKAKEHHEYLSSTSSSSDENFSEDKHRDGAPLSHEIIAGAAAYEVMKGYEKHRESQGEEVKHARIKETLAGLAAAEAINLAEKHNILHKLGHGERKELAVKAAQQTSHLAKEMDERAPAARRHEPRRNSREREREREYVEYKTETFRED